MQADTQHSDPLAAKLAPLGLDDPLLDVRHRRGLAEAVELLPPQIVLSLDGGGVRGIYQARIVQRLIEALRSELGDDVGDALDVFDLIAGSSTGGILAAGLATPGGRLAQAQDRGPALVQLFRKLADKVFPQHRSLVRHARWATIGKYKAAPLEKLLREHLGDGVRLQKARTRLLIPAYDLDAEQTTWFDSMPRTANQRNDVLLWRLARATSAAPTYFRAAQIDGRHQHRYVDGGVGANNPAIKAIAAALQTWTDARRDLGSAARELSPRLPAKVVVVSVGNGTRAPVAPRGHGLVSWGLKVSELFGHSSATAATELAAALPAALSEFDIDQRPQHLLRYVRIDPPTCRAAQLDDASTETLEDLVGHADRQAEHHTKRGTTDFECAVRALVTALCQRGF